MRIKWNIIQENLHRARHKRRHSITASFPSLCLSVFSDKIGIQDYLGRNDWSFLFTSPREDLVP